SAGFVRHGAQAASPATSVIMAVAPIHGHWGGRLRLCSGSGTPLTLLSATRASPISRRPLFTSRSRQRPSTCRRGTSCVFFEVDRCAEHVGEDVRDRLLGAEEMLTREHFPQHHSEAPDVGALVSMLACRLFGRHVSCGAKYHPRIRCCRAQ